MKKRPDGRYVETIVINHKRKYFYGKTKAEAKAKMMAYKEKSEKGPLFADVADEWWETAVLHLQPSSEKRYRSVYFRTKEYFPGHIAEITPADINQIIISYSKTHADKTTRTQLMIINLILKYAVKVGYILYNPAREVTVPKNLPKQKVLVPSDDNIEKIKNSTECTFGMFAYMAMYSGLRRGELLALEWQDIDMEARTITVNKSLGYVDGVPQPKSPKSEKGIRVVPILDKLAEKLQTGKTGLVFHCNGSYLTESKFIMLWNQYKKESGVNCTPHQLRHVYATMLYENQDKVSIKMASQILGHAQVSTTADIYAAIRKSHQKAVFEAMRNMDI